MGMFDYIRCEYPLPGNPPPCAASADFQTKDLTCFMQEYTITTDGRLVDDSGEEDYGNITATLDIYWHNVVASGPGIYTREGEDAIYLGYRVVFSNGRVVEISETENKTKRAAKHKPYWLPSLTDEAIRIIDKSRAESLIGRTMYRWFGGTAAGYPVTVIAENDHEWLVEKEDKRFEIVNRSDRGSIFFDSYEDGKRYKDERAENWERQKKEYEEEISAPVSAEGPAEWLARTQRFLRNLALWFIAVGFAAGLAWLGGCL